MYQQITLIGNLGRDPELRYSASGVAFTNFSVATSRSWTGQDGQRQEKTVWFRVSVWDRQAEACNQYLTKGQRVLVVGEMEEPYVFTDQEGNSRASLQVRAQLASRTRSHGRRWGPVRRPVCSGSGRVWFGSGSRRRRGYTVLRGRSCSFWAAQLQRGRAGNCVTSDSMP